MLIYTNVDMQIIYIIIGGSLVFGSMLVIGLPALIMRSRLVQDFKQNVLVDYLAEHIEGCQLEPKRGFEKDEVFAAGFIRKGNRFRFHDYMQGTIDGVDFESADVYSAQKTDKNTNVRFKGRLFIFDFHKKSEDAVLVLEDYKPQDELDYEQVDFASVEFNEKFNVYTTNRHTVYYILPPHFMKALFRIEKHPGNIGFAFRDGKLYLAIHTGRKTFSFKDLDKEGLDKLETFKEDVRAMYDLVDDLKLNRNIT